MKHITISVVIPVFNVHQYLPQCLDSLYVQNVDGMEVVLVNDGSTDGSYNVCERYAEKYKNIIIVNKENGGLSDARNVGTNVATGEYIYYLDSDDWLAPNAIRTLLDFAIKHDCEIVQGGFYYVYEGFLLCDKSHKHLQVLNKEEAMIELIKNDYIKNFAWGKLYRADIVKKHQFLKDKYFEDAYWQHLIISESNYYGIVPTPLYYYRQRSTGISGEFSLRNIDLIHGYEERLRFIQKYYPIYTSQMVVQLWYIGYELLLIAERTGNEEIRKAYQECWENLNQKYNVLFKMALSSDVSYKVVKKYPYLIPIYNFCRRIVNKVLLLEKFQIIKKNNVSL